MIEDRELDAWREQWSSVAEPPAEFQRKIQQRIKRQDRRFVLGNFLTVIAFLGILIFAVFMQHQSSWMGTGWATGLCALVFVSGFWPATSTSNSSTVNSSQPVPLQLLPDLRFTGAHRLAGRTTP